MQLLESFTYANLLAGSLARKEIRILNIKMVVDSRIKKIFIDCQHGSHGLAFLVKSMKGVFNLVKNLFTLLKLSNNSAVQPQH